jgi:3-dehydroquinate dehydratase-1
MFCIPIIAGDTTEALNKIARANTLADMLELRLDLMHSADLREMIQASRIPAIATYRSKPQGGQGSADPETCTRYLLNAIREGADFVDVELGLPPKWRQKVFHAGATSRIVISTHICDTTPSRHDLDNILLKCIDTGAPVVKIVTRAKTWEDNLRLLELIPRAQNRGIKISAFCMGPVGRISRIFSHLMGGYLTFASLGEGQESAAGQIPIDEMKRILEHLTP